VRERFADPTFAYKDSSKPVMCRERVPSDLQRATKMSFGGIKIAVIATDYTQHQPRSVVVRFLL